ncbi:MAG: acyl-CoA thioesterase [Myxococcota bacterium]
MANPIDRLIARLDLEQEDTHTFLGGAGPGGQGFQGRLYGGLVAAQAYIAAARTVDVGPIHSMHAYFLRPGRSSLPIRYEVEEIKQGKRFQARQVRAIQDDQALFQALASFSAEKPGVEHQDAMPETPRPDGLPNRDEARGKTDWREQPIDLRTDDPRGEGREPSHWVWMRPMAALPADPVMHTATLIFATDRALLRTAALPHQSQGEVGEFAGASLDHTLWFHGEVTFEDWHLHAMQSPVARHERGLVLGGIFRADGTRVVTTAQEGALRFA